MASTVFYCFNQQTKNCALQDTFSHWFRFFSSMDGIPRVKWLWDKMYSSCVKSNEYSVEHNSQENCIYAAAFSQNAIAELTIPMFFFVPAVVFVGQRNLLCIWTNLALLAHKWTSQKKQQTNSQKGNGGRERVREKRSQRISIRVCICWELWHLYRCQ